MVSDSAVTELASAWRSKVERHEAQFARLRTFQNAADEWGPLAAMFAPGDPTPDVEAVVALAEPGETWLDIGAGGGRMTVPLAARAGRVIAQDASPGMVGHLQEEVANRRLDNVRVLLAAPWPIDDLGERVDVAFSAHVLYFVQHLMPFVLGMERHATRVCAVLLGDQAGNLPPADAWMAAHGEPIARLPALDDFVAVLQARGAVFDVQEVPMAPFGGGRMPADRRYNFLRARCLVAPGTPKDERLREWFEAQSTDAPSVMEMSRLGLVTWKPSSK